MRLFLEVESRGGIYIPPPDSHHLCPLMHAPSMWHFYNGKSILVTGGSGFLGTALVHRLIMSTSFCRIFLVCRGGME